MVKFFWINKINIYFVFNIFRLYIKIILYILMGYFEGDNIYRKI